MSSPIYIVSAINDDVVARGNLMRSPDVATGGLRVVGEHGHLTAGAAYNAGLRRVSGDNVAFIHQDVYLPTGWLDQLSAAIKHVEAHDESWGVIGVWGIRGDRQFAGRVWCTGGKCEHVGLVDGVHAVDSMDEIVIVLNNRHGLKFDEKLPGYHLYATDIVLEARRRGLGAYTVTAPVVHNSRCNPQPLDKAYRAAYRYMQRKWAAELPLKTCVVDVTRFGWPLYKQVAKNHIGQWRGRLRAGPRSDDPVVIAERLGYEQLAEINKA